KACQSPWRMLEFLRGRASGRELRLFACACCRRIERLIPNARRKHLTVLQRWAKGSATVDEVGEAVGCVLGGWDPKAERDVVVRELIADVLLAFIDHGDDPAELARVVAFRAQD